MKNKREKFRVKMYFLDSNIFINWLKANTKKIKEDTPTQISGFILYQIEKGNEAYTSNLVKEEIAIWLSRYKRSKLSQFLNNLKGYTSLKIINADYNDQLYAEKILGTIPLGYIDCVNLSIMNRLDIQNIYSTDKGFDGVEGIDRIFNELEKDLELKKFLKWIDKNILHG